MDAACGRQDAGRWRPGRGSGRAEGAGLGSLRGRTCSGPPWRMFFLTSLRRLVLRSAQRLRGVRGTDHIQEVVYVELWMLHALFCE